LNPKFPGISIPWYPLVAEQQKNNPLHGVTLEKIVTTLVEWYGWEKLGKWIKIKCFNSNPSVKSSLKFLRKTPWARSKVENLYLVTLKKKQKQNRK
jgi:uncharacterized protein (DUF2132 family)